MAEILTNGLYAPFRSGPTEVTDKVHATLQCLKSLPLPVVLAVSPRKIKILDEAISFFRVIK
jgi:hypothetical protein